MKEHPLRGLCYVLAELIYYSGGDEKGLRPHRYTWKGQSHWWLQDCFGNRVDPTASQFDSPFPYHLGKACGFLTNRPSKRALLLLQGLDAARWRQGSKSRG